MHQSQNLCKSNTAIISGYVMTYDNDVKKMLKAIAISLHFFKMQMLF